MYKLHTPTKIVFGKNTELETANLLKEFGAHKILVVYGMNSVKKSGLLDKVLNVLKQNCFEYYTLEGITSNPLLSRVYEGITLCKKNGIDFLLAIGGGSVIDTAKAIGYGVANEGDVWDFYCQKRKPEKSIPVSVILTIAAAGSEMSDSSVITNDNGMIKRGCNSDLCRPKFAILNPELTLTLPKYQTMCGCADIIMHSLERFCTASPSLELTDKLTHSLIENTMLNTKILKDDLTNIQARSEIMWAGSLSHNGLMGFGSDGGDWATHKLSHELSGKFNTAHGASLTAIWASWARYVFKNNVSRFASFGRKLLDTDKDTSDENCALNAIRAMEKYFNFIELPISIPQLLNRELTDEEINEMALKCSMNKTLTLGSIKKLQYEDMVNIYKMANQDIAV